MYVKNELIKLYRYNKIFIHYCCISFFCTIIMWILYISINFMTGGLYLVANVISYVVSFTILFLLDRRLFRAKPIKKIEKIKQANNFIIFRGIGLIIDSLLLTMFIEIFGIPNIISKVFSSSITFSYNYVTNKLFVFKNRNF